MKLHTLISMLLAVLFTCQLNAQTKATKVINDIENGRDVLEKVRVLFPKKKNKNNSDKPAVVSADNNKVPPVKAGTTLVTITGIEFSKLKTLTENTKACSGVQSATMKYNSISSSIEVQHSGTTEALLKLMGETSKEIFTEANIESFEEGKINIKLK